MNQFGVSQKAIVVNRAGKILSLRRGAGAPYRPLTWDLPGGDLDFGEEAIPGIIREIKEEAGLDVDNIKPFDVESHINRDSNFWVTIGYIAKVRSDKVVLSFEHDQFSWLSPEEFLKLESADKLKRFVSNYLKLN